MAQEMGDGLSYSGAWLAFARHWPDCRPHVSIPASTTDIKSGVSRHVTPTFSFPSDVPYLSSSPITQELFDEDLHDRAHRSSLG